MFEIPHIAALLQSEFKSFNAQLEGELFILRPPAASSMPISAMTQFTQSAVLRSEIRKNALLHIEDCDVIAVAVVNFARRVQEHGLSVKYAQPKSVDLHNGINIDIDQDGYLRLLIKSKIKATDETHQLMQFGSFKAIKSFALRITFDEEGNIIREKTDRVVTMTRPASKTGYSKQTRAEKTLILNAPRHVGSIQSIADELISEGFERVELAQGGELYLKDYVGLSLWTIQKSMAWRGESFKTDFIAFIIFGYLFELYKRLKNHIWTIDLKQTNTCLGVDPVTFSVNSIAIIDCDSCAVTYSMDFKRIPGRQNNLSELLKEVHLLRNNRREFERRENIRMASNQPTAMEILKRQLMIEILNMGVVFGSFPYVIGIEGLSTTKPFNDTNIDQNLVKIIRSDSNTPAFAYLSQLYNQNPFSLLIAIFANLPSDTPIPFREFLRDLKILRLRNGPFPWPAEFNDDFIDDFGDCVDNFLPRALAFDRTGTDSARTSTAISEPRISASSRDSASGSAADRSASVRVESAPYHSSVSTRLSSHTLERAFCGVTAPMYEPISFLSPPCLDDIPPSERLHSLHHSGCIDADVAFIRPIPPSRPIAPPVRRHPRR